jgi:hypothetical protein
MLNFKTIILFCVLSLLAVSRHANKSEPANNYMPDNKPSVPFVINLVFSKEILTLGAELKNISDLSQNVLMNSWHQYPVLHLVQADGSDSIGIDRRANEKPGPESLVVTEESYSSLEAGESMDLADGNITQLGNEYTLSFGMQKFGGLKPGSYKIYITEYFQNPLQDPQHPEIRVMAGVWTGTVRSNEVEVSLLVK